MKAESIRLTGGTRAYAVGCAECGAETSLPAYRCPMCAGPLVIVPEEVGPTGVVAEADAVGIWRHRALLPRTRSAVTLGEGATPLVPLPAPDGVDLEVYAKLESLNPTLSFKDRAMALAASTALDLGLPGLMLASTGNAAVSAAAYAAAAGLPCRVYCATGSSAQLKLAVATAHGADVQLVDGDYSAAYARAATAEAEGWFNVTTTYRNPVLAEAYRGAAVEIVEQLGNVPDVVVVPVGAGPLLRGLLGGFTDLVTAGHAGRVPKLLGVQAAACAPLAHAWGQRDWAQALAEPLTIGPTRAAAIADSLRGYEREGLLTLAAARESGGAIHAVDEASISSAAQALAHAGVFAEPAAAAAMAAVMSQAVRALSADASTVVLMITGHGAKESIPVAATANGSPALRAEVP